MACRLKKGFLALRKAGHLCIETEKVPYVDYQKREKMIEVGKQPFPPGNVDICYLQGSKKDERKR